MSRISYEATRSPTITNLTENIIRKTTISQFYFKITIILSEAERKFEQKLNFIDHIWFDKKPRNIKNYEVNDRRLSW